MNLAAWAERNGVARVTAYRWFRAGLLSVPWRMSATRGPTVGSLRLLAAAAQAQLGDELVVVFNVRGRAVSAERIAAGAIAAQRLAVLLGKPVRRARAALARSLSCPAGDVEALLRARGDDAIADLIETGSAKGRHSG